MTQLAYSWPPVNWIAFSIISRNQVTVAHVQLWPSVVVKERPPSKLRHHTIECRSLLCSAPVP